MKSAPARGTSGPRTISLGLCLDYWPLIPDSRACTWPDYVPQFIRHDYQEACLIEFLSPKASATLSRRCVQALIRDFYNVSKSRLIDEINAIEAAVGKEIADALHVLRDIGNIGAHPERNPNVIVDVDAGEATAMINLIELLIEETYVARHNREEQVARVKMIAAAKAGAKALPVSPAPTETS